MRVADFAHIRKEVACHNKGHEWKTQGRTLTVDGDEWGFKCKCGATATAGPGGLVIRRKNVWRNQ